MEWPGLSSRIVAIITIGEHKEVSSEMASLKKISEDGVKQLSQGAAYCGIPTVAFSSGSLTGSSTTDSVVPLIVLLGAFVSAGVWMFRRWGKSPEVEAPPEPSPGLATSARQEPKPTNA